MLFVALGLMAAGCQRHQAPQPTVGDLDAMGLPESAQLVAFTKLPSAPLLFIAGQDGRVCYAANRQVVASFQVEEGHQVYLHGGYSDGRTATKLSLQGSTIYETSTRAAENRLYFIPDLR
ncbi:MAG: hypothetical protein AAGC44_13480 [Planctomycetota bacterium]